MTKGKPWPCAALTKEIRLTFLSLVWISIIWLLLSTEMLTILLGQLHSGDWVQAGNQAIFMVIVGFIQLSILVYLLARLAQLYRHRSHHVLEPNDLLALYEPDAPALSVLIPSYNENPEVVRKTLLSAALLDYPAKQVVLLIDNSPIPGSESDRALLEQTRQLVQDLSESFRRYGAVFDGAWKSFSQRNGDLDIGAEVSRIAELYEHAATCLAEIKASTPNVNHEDDWFIVENLTRPADAHRAHADHLRRIGRSSNEDSVTPERVAKEYFRLSRLFRVDISAFERKRYVNLSHEPNKAMNLNSYLSLMGKTLLAEAHGDGQQLRECREGETGQHFPAAEFVITLDADSILSPDYALKLISVMKQSGHERLAVVQTPYSAFPGASKLIERIAGATTDIQYLIHQGFTTFNATFWVGANALLRVQALMDIATHGTERGFPITRYIQDRTVIEDTESSVDLVVRGWKLLNYPQRLAYSATPPDFGALLIQRRRWANGGLIIFPKFWRYVTRRPSVPNRIGHTLMGTHYLTSLAILNIGILLLLWLPSEEAMRSPWMPLSMLPYLVVYTRDLNYVGYRYSDMWRVYALNLLLVPVHLGGVFKSIAQILTGARTPFGRTPKVANRTAVPLLYLLATYGFLACFAAMFVFDLLNERWLHAAFAAINGALLGYAIVRYIGLRATVQDLRIAMDPRLAGSRWLAGSPVGEERDEQLRRST